MAYWKNKTTALEIATDYVAKELIWSKTYKQCAFESKVLATLIFHN